MSAPAPSGLAGRWEVADAPAPVVRYMGNKSALARILAEEAARLAAPGSLVVDPMAGSHAVTRVLRRRHRILASDAQAFSSVIGRAFVDNCTHEAVAAGDADRWFAAADRRLARPARGFLERAYSGTYFGRRQCRHLDALRGAVEDVAPPGEEPLRSLLLCATFVAACRAQASPGHFAQFLPPAHPRTRDLRRVDVRDVAASAVAAFRVPPGIPGSRSLALPWRDLVDQEARALSAARLWYLDPPYTRDQYSRFYHVLETLALDDRPALAHRARYREARFRSGFCSTRAVASEMGDLLHAVRRTSPRAAVLLSYSSRGLLGRQALEELAAASGFRVARFRAIRHVYSTQGKGVLRGAKEWLFTLLPEGNRAVRGSD